MPTRSGRAGAVTGYGALPGRDGVTFSGGKLVSDLTLPKPIRALQAGDPDAAWAAGDLARAVVGRHAGSPLEQAAVDLDRASREPGGRIPARGPVRVPSLLLAAAHAIPDRDTRQLVAALATFAEAVAVLRARQGRPHQAAAASRAAQQLHAHHSARRPRAVTQDAPAVGLRATRTASRGIRR